MAGPISMGFVGQSLGLSWSFVLVGVAGVVSLICLGFLREEPVTPSIEAAPLS